MNGLDNDAIAKALSKNPSWLGHSGSAEWVQTHISHVFLVGDRVFKLRKAVKLPFLDFSTRSLRNDDCLREIALNRRLSPSVYLGVARVLCQEDSVRIGSIEDSPKDAESEHVVVMRRLPSGHDALSMLQRNQLEPRHLEAIAERIQDFHASHRLGCPAPWTATAWFERIAEPIQASISAIADSKLVSGERVEALGSKTQERLMSLRACFEDRRLQGRAVDGHGDLHLDHVWFEEETEGPLIIDCVEFNDDLRRIDAASEIAFLAMDLCYRKRREWADVFLHAYASRADDYGLFEIVDFFAAYRALVRAKVAALVALQESIAEEQRSKARLSTENHFALAETFLEPSVDPGLIVICGTVGSGKSTVARNLTHAGRGISIASDRVRKSIAGISATALTATRPDEGIYRPEETERVYRGLLERAEPVIQGGRTAILDASFSTRAHRDAARAWARERRIPIELIEVRCDPIVAESRLRERQLAGLDISDAGPDFLPVSRDRFEAPDEWPASSHKVIWSS